MRATDYPPPQILQFASREALYDALTRRIASALQHDLQAGSPASLALSGGTSPVPVFDRLAEVELDWSGVLVTLVDERWVPVDHEASNEGLIRRHLLRSRAGQARLLGLKTEHGDPETAQESLAQRLGQLPAQFSSCLLGMGVDGHTASFFPGSEQLATALSPADNAPNQALRADSAGYPRMTLTLPRILASKELLLLLTGEEKLAIFEQARQPGPVEQLPVRAVIRQRQVPLVVYWAA